MKSELHKNRVISVYIAYMQTDASEASEAYDADESVQTNSF